VQRADNLPSICSPGEQGDVMSVRKSLSIVAVMVAILGSLVLGSPANAAPSFEFDHATSINGSVTCVVNSNSHACGIFDPSGDHFYIGDASADGHSAAIYWHNYLNSTTSTVYRLGACVNSLGNGKLGNCNKNFYEGSTVEWKVCLYDSGTPTASASSYYDCSAPIRTTA
jgi:hypothetical protein